MIHYHGFPFSGGADTHRSIAGKHIFISYAHSRDCEHGIELCQSFALDNGAYSVWKRGDGEIDLPGYADFVRQWYRHPGFDFCVMPDVVDGDVDDNARIRAAWCVEAPELWAHSAPVWHMHEPLELLAQFCRQHRIVCLGSSGEFSVVGTTEWWGRMSDAMEACCDDQGRPSAKLHGLRMLDPTIFSHLPLSSADSTNTGRNCGIDQAWGGPYAPKSPRVRALVLMDRIESHGSAARWSNSRGVTKNLELFG